MGTSLWGDDAEGKVAGCSFLPLLLPQEDSDEEEEDEDEDEEDVNDEELEELLLSESDASFSPSESAYREHLRT